MARSRVVSFSDRKKTMLEAIGNPKILTVSVAALCVLLFVLRVSQPNLAAVCLQPAKVLTSLQIYRIVTAPFFHSGLVHVLINMIAWMMIARDFEKTTGTFAALYTIFILLIPLMAMLHSCAAFLIDALAGTSTRYECAVGISGLLFALLVVNVELSAGSTVNVFGFFSMPTRWYPLALAGLLQFLAPNLSLMGHLSGILLGYCIVFGYLQPLTPSDYKFEQMEEDYRLTSIPLWQPVPSSTGLGMVNRGDLPQINESSASSIWGRMQTAWAGVVSWFSGPFSSESSQPFSGEGRTLGDDREPVRAGRVPPTSRLLQEAAGQKKTAAGTDVPKNDSAPTPAGSSADTGVPAETSSTKVPTEASGDE